MHKYFIKIFIFFYLGYSQEFFQNYDLKQFSVVDGLSHQSITSIMKDHEGFLWIGTVAGLNKFDGYEFKVFQHKAFDKSSISDNFITCIFQDSEDKIWIGTANGLNIFDRSRQKFKTFFHTPNDLSTVVGDRIMSICEDINGLIWIVTSNGVSIYDKKQKKFRNYYREISDLDIIGKETGSIYSDAKTIWIGTRRGLFSVSLVDASVIKYESIINDYNSISSNIITALYKDSKKNFWVGTILGLNRINQNLNQIDKFYYNITDKSSLNSDYITAVSENKDGNLWVGTAFGLNYYLNNSETFFDLSSFFKSKGYSVNLNIKALLEDDSGNLWIGTEAFGLIQLYKFKKAFNILEHKANSSLSLSSNSVTDVKIDIDGNWWIGTNWGLNRYQPSPELIETYYQQFNSKYVLSNDFITSLAVDPNNNVWVGTLGGLNVINQKKDTVISFLEKDDYSSILTNTVNAIKIIQADVWIAQSNGMTKINFHTMEVKQIPQLEGFFIKDFIDYGTDLWLSLEQNGLIKFNKKNKSIKIYKHDSNDEKTISSNQVNFLYKDSKNALWVGTASGLNRYDSENDRFRLYSELNKYTSDYVLSIIEDSQGYYWISSNRGLSRLEVKNDGIISLKNFAKEDGVDVSLFKPVNYKYGDDLLFFGTNRGLIYFNSSDIELSSYKPSIRLKNIQTNKRNYFYLDNDDILNLENDEQFINFHFVSLDYTKPEHNQFAYRLAGYDDDWIRLANRHQITFNNMGAGLYKLEVKGTNSDNIWSDNILQIRFKIEGAFYTSWWFIIGVLLLIALIISMVFRSRLKKINEIRSIRARIARDLHDDIGASLTEITLMSEMTRVVNDINKRNEFLGKIEEISRTLVSSLGDLVWSIDTKNDRFSDLLEKMKDFAGSILGAKDIRINYNIKGMDPDDKIDQHIKQTIYLIFKEAVNNVVKHSCAKRVDVLMNNTKNEFLMRISDNGKGLDLAQKQKGNGLNNMKIRAKRIKASIDFKVENGLIIELRTIKLG